ncbi:MAG: glycosyltransferase family 2 protein [Nanoarchaeota archaeon]
MYKGKKIVAITGGYNEEGKIGKVINKIPSYFDEIVAVDDGSTDKTQIEIKKTKAILMINEINRGAGFVLRRGMNYAIKKEYDIAVIIAGDNQDNPKEAIRLIQPIIEGCDIVQGSRYLKGIKKIPLFRKISTKLFTLCFGFVTGCYLTDASNGFRAYKVKSLRKIDFSAKWLDKYELEPYILIQAIKKGYKINEVPVSKYYNRKQGYTKMKPVIDWWRITKPLLKNAFKK